MDHCEATSENGIFRKGDTRISDLSGRKILPVGNDNFTTVVEDSVFIDKSLLIADILDSGSSVTLFCRPRRFGKSLNLSMLQRFFEESLPNDPLSVDTTPLFEGLRIWDTDDGRYREHHGAYPVVRFSFNGLKRTTPIDFLEGLESAVAAEFQRHSYLEESAALSSFERDLFARLAQGRAAAGEVSQSLLTLSRLLTKHHKSRTVILIDEYNAPIIMEFKRAPRKQSSEKPLSSLALRALEQIDARAYAAAVPSSRPAPLCYGIAFCGKNVAVACSEA